MITKLMTRVFSNDDDFKSKFSDSIDEANESGVAKLVTPEGTYKLAKIDEEEILAEDEDTGELTSITKNPEDENDYQLGAIKDDSDESTIDDPDAVTSTESFSDDEEDKGRGIMIKVVKANGISPLIKVTKNREEFENYSQLFTKSKWVNSFQEGEDFLKSCGIEGYLSEKDFSDKTLNDVELPSDEGVVDMEKADGKHIEDSLKDTEVKVEEGISDKKKAGLKNFSSILAEAIVKVFADNGIDVDKLTSSDLPDELTQSKEKSDDDEPSELTDDSASDEPKDTSDDKKVPVYQVVSEEKPDKKELEVSTQDDEDEEPKSDDTMDKLITSNSDQSDELDNDLSETSTESFSNDKWSIVNTETGLAVKTGKKEDLEKLMKKPEYQKKLNSDKNSPLKFQLVPEDTYSDKETSTETFSEDLSIKKLLTPLGDDFENSEEDVDVTPKIDPNSVEDNKVFSDLSDLSDDTGVAYLNTEF